VSKDELFHPFDILSFLVEEWVWKFDCSSFSLLGCDTMYPTTSVHSDTTQKIATWIFIRMETWRLAESEWL